MSRNGTSLIEYVFKEKSIFGDPIIASTTIKSSKFLKLKESKNTKMKTYEIYEPRHSEQQNGLQDHQNRQVYGEMQIVFSLTTAFPTFDKKQNDPKYSKHSKYSKPNGYSKKN